MVPSTIPWSAFSDTVLLSTRTRNSADDSRRIERSNIKITLLFRTVATESVLGSVSSNVGARLRVLSLNTIKATSSAIVTPGRGKFETASMKHPVCISRTYSSPGTRVGKVIVITAPSIEMSRFLMITSFSLFFTP